MFLILLTFLSTLIVLLITFIKWQHSFWKRKGFPYKPPAIPFGNIIPPWQERLNIAEQAKIWYNEARKMNLNFYGNYILAVPTLSITSVDLVKQILIKDFQHFPDHGFYLNERDDPLSMHLLSLEGDRWKNLRAKLAPAFTSSKTKMMFQGVVNCTVPMLAFLQKNSNEAVNVKELFASYTIDTIGSCGFGIECNSFKQRDNPFYFNGRKVFESTRTEELTNLFIFAFPDLARALRLKVTKPEVEQFFMNLTKETVAYREENNVKRNDFMQLLIDIKNSDLQDPFTIEQLAAQAFIFFLGGFETSSTTGTFCLLELALNQEVQEKARIDVIETIEKYGGEISYEAIQEMKYLTQVIDGECT